MSAGEAFRRRIIGNYKLYRWRPPPASEGPWDRRLAPVLRFESLSSCLGMLCVHSLSPGCWQSDFGLRLSQPAQASSESPASIPIHGNLDADPLNHLFGRRLVDLLEMPGPE